MDSAVKYKLTQEQMSGIAHKHFGCGLSEASELTDGYANTAYAVTLEDTRQMILKVAPSAAVKMMSYEKDMMKTEVDSLRLVNSVGSVPVPSVLEHDDSLEQIDSEYFIMERLEGAPYNTVKGSMTEEERANIERELGVYSKRINAIKARHFGRYASVRDESLAAPSWGQYFEELLQSVIDDGRAAGVELPIAYEEIEREVAGRLDCLDEVTEPCLVHWDLWDGNVFVKNGTITGIIDFERALWGDPLMEFYFGRLNQFGSKAFLEGYSFEGWTQAARNRRLLYDLYLDLILVIECAYRQYEDQNHIDWTRNNFRHGWECFIHSSFPEHTAKSV
jgi:aminoglycoside phosphotransferase (APT) family kinase protein